MDYVEIEYKERDVNWAMSDLQSHDYYELYLLVDGKREFFFENKVFNLTAPTFCVIPPFSMHKTSGGSYKRININVSPALLTLREKKVLDELSKGIAHPIDFEQSVTISELLKRGAKVSLAETEEKQSLILAFVHTALYLIESAVKYDSVNSELIDKKRRDNTMLEVVSFINENYKEPLTLKEISDNFYISKNTLSSKFRATMQCSVMEYLSFVRINRAKELLSTTNMDMEKISEECGYSSANYFSLIFKNIVGLPPTSYRKSK